MTISRKSFLFFALLLHLANVTGNFISFDWIDEHLRKHISNLDYPLLPNTHTHRHTIQHPQSLHEIKYSRIMISTARLRFPCLSWIDAQGKDEQTSIKKFDVKNFDVFSSFFFLFSFCTTSSSLGQFNAIILIISVFLVERKMWWEAGDGRNGINIKPDKHHRHTHTVTKEHLRTYAERILHERTCVNSDFRSILSIYRRKTEKRNILRSFILCLPFKPHAHRRTHTHSLSSELGLESLMLSVVVFSFKLRKRPRDRIEMKSIE